MKYYNFLFLGIIALTANFNFASQKIKEGQDYVVLNNPITSASPNKVELIKIFSYLCPHCKMFDPLLQKYENNLKDPEVTFRNIHVFWSPEFMNLIRLNIAVSENQMVAIANPYIFNAISDEKVNLIDEKTTVNWLKNQTGFDGKKIAASYQSQDNKNKAKKMSLLTTKYQLESTPTIIVGERYKVNLASIKSEADLARILDGLIDLSKKDKLPINTVINSGAELTYQANQTK